MRLIITFGLFVAVLANAGNLRASDWSASIRCEGPVYLVQGQASMAGSTLTIRWATTFTEAFRNRCFNPDGSLVGSIRAIGCKLDLTSFSDPWPALQTPDNRRLGHASLEVDRKEYLEVGPSTISFTLDGTAGADALTLDFGHVVKGCATPVGDLRQAAGAGGQEDWEKAKSADLKRLDKTLAKLSDEKWSSVSKKRLEEIREAYGKFLDAFRFNAIVNDVRQDLERGQYGSAEEALIALRALFEWYEENRNKPSQEQSSVRSAAEVKNQIDLARRDIENLFGPELANRFYASQTVAPKVHRSLLDAAKNVESLYKGTGAILQGFAHPDQIALGAASAVVNMPRDTVQSIVNLPDLPDQIHRMVQKLNDEDFLDAVVDAYGSIDSKDAARSMGKVAVYLYVGSKLGNVRMQTKSAPPMSGKNQVVTFNPRDLGQFIHSSKKVAKTNFYEGLAKKGLVKRIKRNHYVTDEGIEIFFEKQVTLPGGKTARIDHFEFNPSTKQGFVLDYTRQLNWRHVQKGEGYRDWARTAFGTDNIIYVEQYWDEISPELLERLAAASLRK